ncbi:hypothetical protein HOLleu_36048 [Holothuria leucospilota]|uniref:DDE Tnp4 domain-containing protein n=1 Tax=Holothuria leucospilota TaxID=206669 RepID=A0A9Q0YJA7_HOLLE|nr:hypothetical protein HOLleu_36048 [Holothuria leucospilota]
MAIRGFPHMAWAIDGIHVGLHGLICGCDHELFTLFQGFYNIYVQLVCDINYRTLDVMARQSCCTHRSRIFQESGLSHAYQNGILQSIFMGDSGYPKPWLLTPIPPTQTAAEETTTRLP